MNINTIQQISPNTLPKTGSTSMPDQGAAFAERLEKAVAASQQAESASAGSLKNAGDAKLKQACQEMEAVFLNMMLTQMRATVPKDKLMGQSSQEDIMRSLLDTEQTKNMAQAGGIGLADMIYRQLSAGNNVMNNSAIKKGQATR